MKLQKKPPAAVSLGRLGGSVTLQAKADAALENGKKGGWPKGRPRGPRLPGHPRAVTRQPPTGD